MQVVLHWLVALLVLGQYATSGAIVRTHQIHLIGQRQSPTELLLHVLHNRLGLLLTVLMGVRLGHRLWAGAPEPLGSPSTGSWSVRMAAFVHAGFYAVLLAEGVTGAIASYVWWPASGAHVVLFKLLLCLLATHVAGVLWHQFVLGDSILGRMLPRRASVSFGWRDRSQ